MLCAVYCRLSKEDESSGKESESIQNQKSMLAVYAMERQWDIYDIYSDDDSSGADRDRPRWNDMLLDARDGKFQIILCKNQSRFTRDMEMVEKYIHGLFPLWGIRFVAVLDNADTELKGNKKARQISGLINEWYLEDLSDNIRAVLDQKRRAGKYVGSFAPYGYQKDPADHNRLIIDEEAAQIVRKIYSDYLGGTGTHKIAAYLNENGVPNPAAYKRMKGFRYHNAGERECSGLWSGATVSRILRSEVYTGTLVQGVKQKAGYKSKRLVSVPPEHWVRVQNCHEAIIDEQSFLAAGMRLASNTRSDGTGKSHTLSGRLRCADCGGRMVKASHVYKGKRREYLQCGTYAFDRRKSSCTRHSVRLDALTQAVCERLRGLVAELYIVGDISRFRQNNQNNKDDRVQGVKKGIMEAQRQITRLSAAVRGLYLDKTDGIITSELFSEMSLSFESERESVRRHLNTLEDQLVSLEAESSGDDELKERVSAALSGNIGREMYDMLIERVEIGEKDFEAGTQGIHIFWNI